MAKMPQDGHCWPSWEGDPYNLGDKHLGQQFRVFLPKTANMAKVFPPAHRRGRHTKPRRVCGRAILQHFYIFLRRPPPAPETWQTGKLGMVQKKHSLGNTAL